MKKGQHPIKPDREECDQEMNPNIQASTHMGWPSLARFADLLLEATCAVVYIVWEQKDGTIRTHLLMSKFCLAGIRSTTILRLELPALVLLCRLLLMAAVNFSGCIKRINLSTKSEVVIAATVQGLLD